MNPSKQHRYEQIVTYATTLHLAIKKMLKRQSILEPLVLDEELKSTFSEKFQDKIEGKGVRPLFCPL